MFSANGLPENCVYRPKNGPVPCRPVNAYNFSYPELRLLTAIVGCVKRTMIIACGAFHAPYHSRSSFKGYFNA